MRLIMIRLVIIRGLPGSGKSTLARTRFADFVHLEADMYFSTQDGKYAYDADLIKDAHNWCLLTTRALLWSGQRVVVSNTFSQLWELNNYLQSVHRDEVMVTEATGEWTSIHNISEEKMQIIRERWEPLPYEDWEYVDLDAEDID
jgi:adenylate kinase family enzyme